MIPTVQFSGMVVTALHIVTIQVEQTPDDVTYVGRVKISLSNGVVLQEFFKTEEEGEAIVSRFHMFEDTAK